MSFIKYECQSILEGGTFWNHRLPLLLPTSEFLFCCKVELCGSSYHASLVFLWVCLFNLGYRQEIRLSHWEKRL